MTKKLLVPTDQLTNSYWQSNFLSTLTKIQDSPYKKLLIRIRPYLYSIKTEFDNRYKCLFNSLWESEQV